MQVAYERGLLSPQEIQNAMARKRGGPNLVELRLRVASLEDFSGELCLLERLIISRGHILIKSPPAHPEIAGVGIEYHWGAAKRCYRRRCKKDSKLLKGNVQLCLSTLVLTPERIRRFARRTRDHMRGYLLLRDDPANNTHSKCEQFRQKSHTHRCVLDQDSSPITSSEANFEVELGRRQITKEDFAKADRDVWMWEKGHESKYGP